MTRTAGNVTYKCDHCGKEEESQGGDAQAYPDGWGTYEHYPVKGEVNKGDLCGECIAPILPIEEELIEIANDGTVTPAE